MMKDSKAYYRGCLLGGAIGDALGYPVEFLTKAEIYKKYGERGIRDLELSDVIGKAMISDDTQLTTFTVDGLLWADRRAEKRGVYAYIPCIFYSYQKWLYTQTGRFADKNYEFLLNGEILRWEELFARRAPGKTCLEALSGSINGKYGTMKNRINNSKGCGAVMRVAPVGLYFFRDHKFAFKIGAESGALTHGHSSGFLPAGYMAWLIASLIQGIDLAEAVRSGLDELRLWPDSDETCEILEKAIRLAESDIDPYGGLVELGEGWTGEQALAIAVYCALKYPDNYEEAVCLAVNHDGDSDSTGSICGSIMGAYLGELEIPFKWIQKVELAELMTHGADKLLETTR